MKNGNYPESYKKIRGTIRFQTSKLVDYFFVFIFFFQTRKYSYFSVRRLVVSVNNRVYCVLICSYAAHRDSKFLVKQFRTINIAHLSKCVEKLNLIVMFKPKYICIFIFTGRFLFVCFFFSLVGCIASCTLHFCSGFFPSMLSQGLKFWL